ncbi:response regulator transcription factor [Arcobacter sp. FWKO B]|uniref:response regulator transcription factor n=1 Tax=Arcobacter sp. FWKO B TaxID=2593672 RepID=UPI0018A66E5A|nr:response regulator [Arcobacter sp. FWKO B]QOG11488.1 response regulator [Arcobacter sp. FWKO B]
MTAQEVYTKTQNLTVLFVEDEQSVRDKTALILNDLFAKVDTAVDGHDGLNKYNTYNHDTKKYYDLVVTDINMPNLDGLSMVEELIKINPNQQVIVVSAYGDYEKLQKIINLGIKSYIKKPIEINDFFEKLFAIASQIEENSNNLKNKKDVKQFQSLVEKSNQIFVIFDKNCIVQQVFKPENLDFKIVDNIINEHIATVLYPDDKSKKLLFEMCFENIESQDNQLTKKLHTSVLPKEYISDNKVLMMEYNILSDNKYLLILSDQTVHYNAKEELMMQKSECQMMLWAALHKSSFLKLKTEYEEFLADIDLLIEENNDDDLQEKLTFIDKKIEKFKENFIIIHMDCAKRELARFIDKYTQLIKTSNQPRVEIFKEAYKFVSLKDEFNKDIQKITNELSKVLNIE